MKLISTFTLFLLSVFAFAQNHGTSDESRFSFGINYSPSFCYRTLTANDNSMWLLDLRNEMETARYGFNTGIVANYRILPRFQIESGIQFTDNGYQHRIDSDKFEVVDPNHELSDPAIPEKGILKYHYYYLSIPAKINYSLWQKNSHLFVSVGASADYFLDARQKSTIHYREETKRVKTSIDGNFNQFNLSGLFSLGFEKPLTPKVKFRVEPAFRYSLRPLFDGNLNEHTYSFGVNMVLLYVPVSSVFSNT